MKKLKIKQEKPTCPVGWKPAKQNGRWVCVPTEKQMFTPMQINNQAPTNNSPWNVTPNYSPNSLGIGTAFGNADNTAGGRNFG